MMKVYQPKGNRQSVLIMRKDELIADYNFWVKFDDWNIEEMTALVLGYNPLYFDRKFVDQLKHSEIQVPMTQEEITQLIQEYEKAQALIMNSIEAGRLKFRSSPKKFYVWAVSKGIPIFQEFKQAIQDQKPNHSRHHSECGLNAKREKQLYKIILCLAIWYKFNPDKRKNPHTAKFRNAIERAGLTIDDNTIRDIVRTSYELFKDKLDHSMFSDY